MFSNNGICFSFSIRSEKFVTLTSGSILISSTLLSFSSFFLKSKSFCKFFLLSSLKIEAIPFFKVKNILDVKLIAYFPITSKIFIQENFNQKVKPIIKEVIKIIVEPIILKISTNKEAVTSPTNPPVPTSKLLFA